MNKIMVVLAISVAVNVGFIAQTLIDPPCNKRAIDNVVSINAEQYLWAISKIKGYLDTDDIVGAKIFAEFYDSLYRHKLDVAQGVK